MFNISGLVALLLRSHSLHVEVTWRVHRPRGMESALSVQRSV